MSKPIPSTLCRAEFTCEAPNASAVFLLGTFNGWDTPVTPMKRGDTGEWWAVLELRPGHYPYKFVAVYERAIHVRDETRSTPTKVAVADR